MSQSVWTNDNFEQMCWHDNAVHGLRVREGEEGTGELDLDIDYILEWLPPADGGYSFRVAPATLTFQGVSDLVISIDYSKAPAALTPFAIHEIKRELHVYPHGYKDFRWFIEINWPNGFITFNASGFTQTLRAPPIESPDQWLSHEQRQAL